MYCIYTRLTSIKMFDHCPEWLREKIEIFTVERRIFTIYYKLSLGINSADRIANSTDIEAFVLNLDVQQAQHTV